MVLYTSGREVCLKSESVACVEGIGRGLNSSVETRLIPAIEFACNGTIVGWTAAGRMGGGTRSPILQIWRRSDSDGDEYYKQGREIPLSNESMACEEITQPETCDHVFQCRLAEEYQIKVQSVVDIVGIELPPQGNQSFVVYFKPGSQDQYVWKQSLSSNSTTRIGTQDLIVTEDLLLSLNISTGKSTMKLGLD